MLSARPATLADLDLVGTITDAAYAEYAPLLDAPPLPVTEDYRPHIEAGGVFIIRQDAEPVAALTLETHPDHLLIFSLAVLPGLQGQGIGRWMLGFVEDRARRAGLAEVRLYTNDKMTRNIEVYARAGYIEAGRRENPRRPGWVAVDMAKRV